MKILIAFFLASIAIYSTEIHGQNGLSKSVLAPSGLKLRNGPSLDSEVLAIIPTRALVTILSAEVYNPVEDEIKYMEGNWIGVSYDGEEGYVFDKYLTDLSIPSNDDSYIDYGLDLSDPLYNWIETTLGRVVSEDTIIRDYSSKIISHIEGGHKVVRKYIEGRMQMIVQLENHSIWESYFLLHHLIDNPVSISEFKDRAIFIKNADNIVDKIKIGIDSPIEIKRKGDGSTQIKITTYYGC